MDGENTGLWVLIAVFGLKMQENDVILVNHVVVSPPPISLTVLRIHLILC